MKFGLAFSGGKDSLACLLLHKDQLQNITVFWSNTGKCYPETLKIIEYAKSISPNFIEVVVDRESQNANFGLPSDVVPINWTKHGQIMTCQKPVMVQSYLQCCYENIAAPIYEAAKAHEITHLIRGQRLDDDIQSTTKNGDIFEGITLIHPIENWTRNDVMVYLSEHIELPEHFNLGHTSLDCFDCTAYQKETKDVSSYRELKHPELHKQYLARKEQLDSVLREALEI